MNPKIKKILIIVTVLVIIAFVYIALNWSYFFKQVKFVVDKPNQSQYQTAGETGEPNQIQIQSLGIKAPIVESLKSNETAFQEALKTGVVHYPGTAEAGQVGNFYLFGHSSDFALKGGDYKTVFALLPKIELGAEIIVTGKDGKIFQYEAVETFVANSNDVHLLDQNTNGEKIMTIQTSYPIGTALKRWIVKAKLKE